MHALLTCPAATLLQGEHVCVHGREGGVWAEANELPRWALEAPFSQLEQQPEFSYVCQGRFGVTASEPACQLTPPALPLLPLPSPPSPPCPPSAPAAPAPQATA